MPCSKPKPVSPASLPSGQRALRPQVAPTPHRCPESSAGALTSLPQTLVRAARRTHKTSRAELDRRGCETPCSPEAGRWSAGIHGNRRGDGTALPARALAQMRAPECRSATRLLRTKSGSACSPKNAVSSRRDEDAPGSLASRSSKADQSGPWSATPPTPRDQRLRRPRPDLETSGSR